MFTRSNGSTNSNSNIDTAGHSGPARQAPMTENGTMGGAATTGFSTKDLEGAKRLSIISNDLTIMGQDLKIISKSALQVDGEIQGEIRGIDVTVGKLGKVVGTVAAETVTVDGQVMGAIQAVKVTLRTNARVEGDVHHQSLTIEEGAIFDGRSKRQENAADLGAQQGQKPNAAPGATTAANTAASGPASSQPPALHN